MSAPVGLAPASTQHTCLARFVSVQHSTLCCNDSMPLTNRCANYCTAPAAAVFPAETCYLEVDRSAGIRAVTTPVDARSPYFTTMRNVSQIENSVAHYEALARGADMVSAKWQG